MRLHRTKTLVFTLLLASPAGTAAATEIYRWVDDEGVVHFSQWPAADDRDDVTTVTLETSTAPDYEPREDPYSMLNQSRRIHELREELRARQAGRSAEQHRQAPVSLPDEQEPYLRAPFPYFLSRPFHAPIRRPALLQRRQTRVLEEFERLAPPRAHSINSSVHRARIEARQQALRNVRQRKSSAPSDDSSGQPR